MTFKDYIMKEMTSTGDIAGFSRISIPLVTRTWMPSVVLDDPTENQPKRKKKRYEQPQVKD